MTACLTWLLFSLQLRLIIRTIYPPTPPATSLLFSNQLTQFGIPSPNNSYWFFKQNKGQNPLYFTLDNDAFVYFCIWYRSKIG